MSYIDEIYAPRTLGEWARRSIRKTATLLIHAFVFLLAFFLFVYSGAPEKTLAFLSWLRRFPGF